ncbi:uncharacterized protein RHO25_004465 [Cercospora beticola]|uniref:Uncharacterized protein n=1 Tax=Cercospora beticola TaxID=122368 RepID=A0ABZ0NK06_CERBT|nr:hypothetical protein RHO25_004465 [Cercospora beticola]CAK1361989.1 unnamed protein product [Cercospora beticola]
MKLNLKLSMLFILLITAVQGVLAWEAHPNTAAGDIKSKDRDKLLKCVNNWAYAESQVNATTGYPLVHPVQGDWEHLPKVLGINNTSELRNEDRWICGNRTFQDGKIGTPHKRLVLRNVCLRSMRSAARLGHDAFYCHSRTPKGGHMFAGWAPIGGEMCEDFKIGKEGVGGICSEPGGHYWSRQPGAAELPVGFDPRKKNPWPKTKKPKKKPEDHGGR